MPKLRPTITSALWLALLVPFLRWWELTLGSAWMIWSLLFVGAFSLSRRAFNSAHDQQSARRSIIGWLGMIAAARLLQTLVPVYTAWGVQLQTVTLTELADFVVPLWITCRALAATWPKRRGLLAVALVPVWLLLLTWGFSVRMPGSSYSGPLPALTPAERQMSTRLREHVRVLSEEIGPRGVFSKLGLKAARDYIATSLEEAGLTPTITPFVIEGTEYWNIEATVPGRSPNSEVVVAGAHYDGHGSTPGADDNASGVAALLELAKLARNWTPERTIRFVFFANEEPPFFGTEAMGSRVYARKAAAANAEITAMFALETIGYYTDEPGSQRYPFPLGLFYPNRGDFIAFVGNPDSGQLVRDSVRTFRESASFPSQGSIAPSFLPGVFWSDHASFWKEGFPAIMITDTAPFRNPHYHKDTDTLETLDFERLAQALSGLREVLRSAAN